MPHRSCIKQIEKMMRLEVLDSVYRIVLFWFIINLYNWLLLYLMMDCDKLRGSRISSTFHGGMAFRRCTDCMTVARASDASQL